MRGECARHGSKAQVGGFAILHSFSHTTRANISHEKTEQIRARIVRTPAESAWREANAVGVAETGQAGVDPVHTLTG